MATTMQKFQDKRYNLRSREVVYTTPEERKKAKEAGKKRKIEDAKAAGRLIPPQGMSLRRYQQWLHCCGSEAHVPPPPTARKMKKDAKFYAAQNRRIAKEALTWYNKGSEEHGRPKYKLVETLDIQGGTVLHFNFKARPEDKPDAPVELFFAELYCFDFKYCESLGPCEDLESVPSGYNCKYCSSLIKHPRNANFRGCIVD